MSRRNLLYVFVGLILGLIGSTQLPLHAQRSVIKVTATPIRQQDTTKASPSPDVAPQGVEIARPAADAPSEIESRPEPPTATSKVSLQDALHRPYTFAFGKPTTLSEVSRRLTADLGGPVVLDLAALERLEIKPDDTVELELKGVRLKTGLKLLLDQQQLTFRIIPEDNLLILTDKEGADDPLDKVWTELSHLHRDVHEIQDVVEDLRELSGAPGEMDAEGGPRLRKPTIIEEMPETPDGAPKSDAVPKPEPQPDSKDLRPTTPPKRPRTRL
ncbi:MAG: hypothetical protein P4L85_09735 [Paludisphaera borealis]|uniref:hypothetical protein n=1 Tax=Paludisphaera borealis TaxID=1387353 RepID=UPI0028401CF4|nr:hypothetical protein [Paludisphaera borealis]MDR3619620.1 hypothetical protein [Paludisphaera borealis]